MNSSRQSPSIHLIDESSDDETETDNILASLLTQLDELERQQHETVSSVTDALRKQQQKVDVLRKSVREAERIIHQNHVSRQKSKIKRLRVLTAAGTPGLNSSTSVSTSATPKQLATEQPLGNTSEKSFSGGKRHWAAVKGKFGEKSTESTPAPKETPLVPSSIVSATLVGDPSFHQEEDTVMKLDDDDDDEYYSVPPAPVAPIAPAAPISPTETAETRKAEEKPVGLEKVNKSKSVSEMAAEVAAQAAKNKPRPLQRMRPTRGPRGRGGLRGPIGIRGGRGGIGSNTSSRSNSQEAESAKEAPTGPRARGLGIGTGRRSKPFKRGEALGRSSISSKGSDAEPLTSPTAAAAPVPTPARTNGFVAVNTPMTPAESVRTGGKNDKDERLLLSSLPAGAGGSRTFGETSSTKSLPPPKSQAQISSPEVSPVKASRRVAFDQEIPEEPVLFTTKELRAIFGGGNPGSIIAVVKPEDQEKGVVRTESYICLASDAHFQPPGTMCDNAEMIDIYGQEDPVDTRGMVFPLLKKVNKMYMYCGNYTMGVRRMLPVNEWKDGSETVKKHWAKKVQDTEWGREFLVRKGFLRHGEIKNVSLPEIMGYFAIPDDRKGLRFSATALNFHSFNRITYDKMVARASEDNPNGLPLAPIKTLKPNELSPKPYTSVLAARIDSNKTPVQAKKRRRVSEDDVEPDTPATISVRQPTSVGSERGRRASRNNVNYRIAPMDEFSAEEGGKGKEVIELGDDDEEDEDQESVELVGGDEESEGEMVLD